jgi:BMFP domain-containing protein YqiC
MQRLGGHLDEARHMLQQYIDAAAALGLSLDVYIREHLESGSEVFTSTGRIIADLVERVQTLEQAYQALQDAGIISRWFVFLREVDWTIAAGTWENFVPGVPTTLEGLIYALTGLLLGWGLYALLKSLIAIPIKAIGQKNKQV